MLKSRNSELVRALICLWGLKYQKVSWGMLYGNHRYSVSPISVQVVSSRLLGGTQSN